MKQPKPDFHCVKCGYEWDRKVKDSQKIPKCCPLCHSYKWNGKPVEKGEAIEKRIC